MKKLIRNTHREALQSKKSIKVILLFIFFSMFLIGTVSALSFSFIDKTYEEELEKITIKNWFGLGAIQGKYTLIENTYQCLTNCYAEGIADLRIDSVLFNEVKFYDRNNNLKNKDHIIYIEENKSYEIEVIDEKTKRVDCEDPLENGTKICYEYYSYKNITKYENVWKRYNGKVLTEGIYKWRLEGRKNVNENIDWIAGAFGKEFNEWAWWNNSWNYYRRFNVTEYYSVAHTDEPIIFTINASLIWDKIQSDGDDLRIVNATKENDTELSRLITMNTSIGGNIEINFNWTISADDNSTQFDLYYGNAGAIAGTSMTPLWQSVPLSSITELIENHRTGTCYANSFIDTGTCDKMYDNLFNENNIPPRGVWYPFHAVPNFASMNFTQDYIVGKTKLYNACPDIFGTDYRPENYSFAITLDKSSSDKSADWSWILNETERTETACQNATFYFKPTLIRQIGINIDSSITGDGSNALIGEWEAWAVEPLNFSAFGGENNASSRLIVYIPINEYNSTINNVTYIVYVSDNSAVVNVSIFLDGVLNETNSSGINNTNYTFIKYMAEGSHNWTIQAWNDNPYSTTSSSRNLTIDSLTPALIILAPPTTVSFHTINTNLSVNWSANDTNIDTCILEFEGVNRTLICIDNSTGINITNIFNRTITIYVNDTFGNMNSTSRSWNYAIFQNSLTYNIEVIGGNTEDFELNITKDSSLQILTADLVYNLSSSSVSFTSGDTPIITKSLGIPNPSTNSNFTFYFSFTMSDAQIINTSSNNQTVLNLDIGNCSTFTNLIYNFTLLDEENQTQLSNITIEYAFNLFDNSGTTQITNFSELSTANPTTVCINQNLTTSSLSLNAVLKYISTDASYLTRYYNILNFSLKNSSIPNNINLYDVMDSTGTSFQLTFRDSSLAFFPNILVNVNKQYVGSNDFKTVEIPVTDSNGQTILNLVRNTAIYNLIFIDSDKKIVASFININAFCQDFTIGECTLNLDASGEITQTINTSELTGISYTIGYVNSTSIATLTFSSINSTAVTVRIVGTTQNQFGNQSVCDNSLTSTLGTVTCNASSILITDNYLFIDIFSDGNYVTTRVININPSNPLVGGLYGSNGYFIAFFLLLLIIILFSDDKQVLLIMLGMGWVTILILGLIKGTIIGSISGGIWLLVSIITMIWKLKQEEVGR